MVEKELGEVISRMSPSRIDVAQRCLALFKYRYVVPDDLKHPSGWKRAFGAAMDTAANGVYTSKFESHVTPDAEDAAAQFAAAWDAESETVEDWSGTSKSDKLDSGVQGVKQWRENIALYCQPKQLPQLHVQKDVIDEKDNTTWTLHGYVDLVCDMPGHQDVVTDLKTSGRKYSGSAIQVNTQPAAYTYITGTSTFSYHVVTSTKVPKVQVLTAGVDARRSRCSSRGLR